MHIARRDLTASGRNTDLRAFKVCVSKTNRAQHRTGWGFLNAIDQNSRVLSARVVFFNHNASNNAVFQSTIDTNTAQAYGVAADSLC